MYSECAVRFSELFIFVDNFGQVIVSFLSGIQNKAYMLHCGKNFGKQTVNFVSLLIQPKINKETLIDKIVLVPCTQFIIKVKTW